jgi:hypothetical protein
VVHSGKFRRDAWQPWTEGERKAMSSVLSSPPPLADGAAPSVGLQIARLERYTAWARAEGERLRVAGEYPARRRVLQENVVAAHRMMVELLEGRRNGEPA